MNPRMNEPSSSAVPTTAGAILRPAAPPLPRQGGSGISAATTGYPLYAFVRRKRHHPGTARTWFRASSYILGDDLHNEPGEADSLVPDGLLHHYLAKHHDREHAVKGGGLAAVSLEAVNAERARRRTSHDPHASSLRAAVGLDSWTASLPVSTPR
jgi:hypothetical protein